MTAASTAHPVAGAGTQIASPGAANATQPHVAAPLLDVNGIEVIYNHVILVLKGVSL